MTTVEFVGLSTTVMADAALQMGPKHGSVYGLVGLHARAAIPGQTRVHFEFEGFPDDSVDVVWNRPTFALAVVGGPGIYLGKHHEYFLEGVFGGGGILHRNRGFCLTSSVRAGWLF